MFKIKLLILLLNSILLFSCTQQNITSHKYTLDYFGGEQNGLLLRNYLESKLKGYKLYDAESAFLIKGTINNSTSLYITNIDNTSDRNLITTSVNLQVVNTEKNCVILSFKDNISQFYIFSSGDKFISNNQASKKIIENNTDSLTQNFIDTLIFNQHGNCDKK